MKPYLDHLQAVYESGLGHMDRTGKGRVSLAISPQTTYDFEDGFPILTTKKIRFEDVAKELVWFLSGDTKLSTLLKHNIHIWSPDGFRKYYTSPAYQGETVRDFETRILEEPEFAAHWDDLGPIYGYQWRRTPGNDQIKNAFTMLKQTPENSKNVVSAWNPEDIPAMTLEPCHVTFQFRGHDGTLITHLYQRSADMFLGVPYNITSYSLLTSLAARYAGLEPASLVHAFGDAHIYTDHMPKVAEQLEREPKPRPNLVLSDTVNEYLEDILEDQLEDPLQYVSEMMRLEGYNPDPWIWAPLHVGIPDNLMPDAKKRARYTQTLTQSDESHRQ